MLLGIPVSLASSLMELMNATPADFSTGIGPVLVGTIVAAVIGLLAIKLVRYISNKDKFGIFVWYTAILGIVVCGVGIFEHIVGMNIVAYLAR